MTYRKIRHPNVLLLMGVCQTNNLDGMVLLYEDVGLGSLYFYLHQKVSTNVTLNFISYIELLA